MNEIAEGTLERDNIMTEEKLNGERATGLSSKLPILLVVLVCTSQNHEIRDCRCQIDSKFLLI